MLNQQLRRLPLFLDLYLAPLTTARLQHLDIPLQPALCLPGTQYVLENHSSQSDVLICALVVFSAKRPCRHLKLHDPSFSYTQYISNCTIGSEGGYFSSLPLWISFLILIVSVL